jgi:putative chitinase
MNPVTEPQLRAILACAADDSRPGAWLDALNTAMRDCDIASTARQAAFLAQVLHESAELRHLEEALGYSPQRLRRVWPRRFPTDELAAAYGHAPERLANFIYADRLGNGGEASGDGWRYRGRGLIQLTGRDNYTALARALPIDALADPALLLEPAGAALSAGWFWRSHGLNELADQAVGADADAHFAEITRRVNGGINGLDERRAYWQRARRVLAATPATTPAPAPAQ